VKSYLLIVWHDVEPALEGPFLTEEARLERANEIRESSNEHGVYNLEAEGKVIVDGFSPREALD